MASNHMLDSANRNMSELKCTFDHCSDFIIKPYTVFGLDCFIACLSGIVDSEKLEKYVVHPLLEKSAADKSSNTDQENLVDKLEKEWIMLVQTKQIHSLEEASQLIADGQAVFFADRCQTALALDVGNDVQRALEEPKTEVTLGGTQMAFIEKIEINIVLLRQIIHSTDLKVENLTAGKWTNTRITILYMQNLAPEHVIREAKNRINHYQVEGMLQISNLIELINESAFQLFPTQLVTERPDTAASSLLEGKVVIIMNGSPKVAIVPTTFWSAMQTADDYHFGFFPSIFIRWLRFTFTAVNFLLPGLFVSVTSFHPELIPTDLVFTISASEEQVPFPIVLEILMLEIMFEVIREATLRMPRMVGQSIGIVGALILGQAAVQAGIVSAPVVIIVSICGISSFLVPHLMLNWVVRLLKYPFLLLASTFGFYGMGFGMILLLIHVVNLRSFGEYYLTPLAPFRMSFFRDVIIRLPWSKLKRTSR